MRWCKRKTRDITKVIGTNPIDFEIFHCISKTFDLLVTLEERSVNHQSY